MKESTPSEQFEAAVDKALLQLNSGDMEETLLRQRHPLARYRAPHPVYELSCSLMSWALTTGATGMQMQPSSDKVSVYFEKDGELKEVTGLPKKLQEPLVARFKDMAYVDVTSQSREQFGHIPVQWQNKDFNMPATFVPTENGEQVIVQFIPK